MPVTAKLSHKFYERLGDEIANELVDWFNAVDATYRSDLRELNELNYARFDAKVDQRFAEARVETERQIAALRVEMERGFAGLRTEIETLRTEIETLRTEIETLRTEIEGVKGATAAQRADLLKWMFGFWVATVVPLGGLVVGLFTLLR
jgi:predicted  nucleic acid-binding Zn-ribbon protein